MPGQDNGAYSENDTTGCQYVKWWKCESDPKWCYKEDSDEEGSEGWAGRSGGRRTLGREKVGKGEEGLKKNITSIREFVQRLDNLIERLVMGRGSF